MLADVALYELVFLFSALLIASLDNRVVKGNRFSCWDVPTLVRCHIDLKMAKTAQQNYIYKLMTYCLHDVFSPNITSGLNT